MSYWLKNVGQFLEKLDDQAGKAAQEQQRLKTEQTVLDDDDDDPNQLDSILAARGLDHPHLETSQDVDGAVLVDGLPDAEQEAPLVAGANRLVPNEHDAAKSNDAVSAQDPLFVVQAHALAIEKSQEHSPSEERSRKEGDSYKPAASSTAKVNNSEQLATSEVMRGREGDAWDKQKIVDIPDADKKVDSSVDRAEPKAPPAPQKDDDVVSASEAVVSNNSTAAEPTGANQSDTSGDSVVEVSPKTDALGTDQKKTPPPAPKQGTSYPPLKRPPPLPPRATTTTHTAATSSPSSTTPQTPAKPLNDPVVAQLLESQKESRTLRRHVVTLNSQLEKTEAQLEKAEAEIDAQRRELDQAAAQMAKDRARNKEEREKEKARQAEEIKKLKADHQNAIESVRSQMKAMEEKRVQEGGNLSSELEDAIQRERQVIERLAIVEDEKVTLESHIAVLQSQQEALGSRLESLTNTAESAMEREREADQRLDDLLAGHARQISKRQAREAELERMVSELGAALVAAKSHGSRSSNVDSGTGEGDPLTCSETEQANYTIQQEVELLRAQLVHEQQRNVALHSELQDVTKERTDEASVSQTRQQYHDRRVSELSQTVTRLKAELQEAQRLVMKESVAGSFSSDDEDAKQIRSLSEEVLRLREKQTSQSSEISALKNRLKAASARASHAESALEEREQNGRTDYSDVEGGSVVRRRGVKRVTQPTRTIRAALNLEGMQDKRAERIAKTLDVLDAFLSQSGKFLRFHPVARLLFILYLLLLHLWTFILIFFHAHGYETIHGDFGAGGMLPHGPGAMMQKTAPAELGKALVSLAVRGRNATGE